MPRKIRKTISGRQEEVWFTKDDGIFGAYGLKDWYLGLPSDIQNHIVEIQHSISSTMMPAWDRGSLISGPYETHRLILEKWAWSYSSVPPLLATIFEWAIKRDSEVAQLALDEWLALAKKSRTHGAKFLAYRAAIEFYWQRGYTGAKDIRKQGLHNYDLQQIEKYGKVVADLLRKQQLPPDMGPCKPLDRLFLLYKLTGKKEIALTLIDELEQAGYRELPEIVTYKTEFSKI